MVIEKELPVLYAKGKFEKIKTEIISSLRKLRLFIVSCRLIFLFFSYIIALPLVLIPSLSKRGKVGFYLYLLFLIVFGFLLFFARDNFLRDRISIEEATRLIFLYISTLSFLLLTKLLKVP